ncbi:iron chaperone [Streptomyces sp. NPDC014891]|uniref:iron chaperone n=1 Tax=Streptomyces sp. NPDC014891 TaxID=3364929 RepID=UPI0037001BEE
MANTRSSTKSTGSAAEAGSGATYDGFTEEERAAMKERASELKSTARRASRSSKADGEADVLAKIAEMTEADRVLAERIHALVKEHAPELAPKTWYGMPAYAKAGKVVCFFQAAEKFKARYATLGFSDLARLDEGSMWATSFALTELSPADETRIAALIAQAAA